MPAIDINTLLSESNCYACYGPTPVPELAELALLARISQVAAIGQSNLTTFNSGNAAATSFTTASITPTANALVLAFVMNFRAAASNVPTLTGNGLTWVLVTNVAGGGQQPRLYRAMGAAPTAGAVTADFAGQSQGGCLIHVMQFTNVNQSGTNGSGAIVQSTSATSGITNTPSVTLSAFNANSLNAGAFFLTAPVNPITTTPKTGWTQDANAGFQIPITSDNAIFVEHRLATTDNTPSVTMGTVNIYEMMAVEIRSKLA